MQVKLLNVESWSGGIKYLSSCSAALSAAASKLQNFWKSPQAQQRQSHRFKHHINRKMVSDFKIKGTLLKMEGGGLRLRSATCGDQLITV